MKFSELIKKNIAVQPVYEPGRPIETVARELGLDPRAIAKLASNENPFGPSPKAMEAARDALRQSHRYPDGGAHFLVRRLARRHGLEPEQFLLGNGSNEVIELLGHAFLREGDEVVMGSPAFIVYKLVTLLFGAKPVEVPLRDFTHDLEAMREAVTDRTRMVFLPSPNNPTGTANAEEEIKSFVRSLPEGVIFVFDEAYAEYLETPPDLRDLIGEGRPVICLRTFSKIFGLAALRIGYGYASGEAMSLLHRARQPFNVNAIAQAAALAALDDEEFVLDCRRRNAAGLRQLAEGFDRMDLRYVPSYGNFLLVETGEGDRHFRALQERGIIVRPVTPYGLPRHLRVSVGTEEENHRLLTAIEGVLG